MVVIMSLWSSSCQHGCHHVGMVVIILSWLSSCPHGCHHISMVVKVSALLSLCQHGLILKSSVISHQFNHQVIMFYIVSNVFTCWQVCHSPHYGGILVHFMLLWMFKNLINLPTLYLCRYWFHDASIVVIIPPFLLPFWHGFHHANIVVIVLEWLSSCWHGWHNSGMVIIMLAGLSSCLPVSFPPLEVSNFNYSNNETLCQNDFSFWTTTTTEIGQIDYSNGEIVILASKYTTLLTMNTILKRIKTISA